MDVLLLSFCCALFLLGLSRVLYSLRRIVRLLVKRDSRRAGHAQDDVRSSVSRDSKLHESLPEAPAPATIPCTPMHAHPELSAQPSQGCNGLEVRKEFPQLQGQIFLDHAGSTLASAKQVAAAMQDMTHHLYTNPHSQHGLAEEGIGAATALQQAWQLTLDMCQASAEDYEVVFTSGATGALKLVGEIMPWEAASQFVYTQDNHNSVLGIRNLARAANASSMAVTMQATQGEWQAHPSRSGWMQPGGKQAQDPPGGRGRVACLFAMPSESNFSGERYDPSIVAAVQQAGPWGPSSLEAASRRPLAGDSNHTASCSQPSHCRGLRAPAQSHGSIHHEHDTKNLRRNSSSPAQPTQLSHVQAAMKRPSSRGIDLNRLDQHLVATSSCPEQPCEDSSGRPLGKDSKEGCDGSNFQPRPDSFAEEQQQQRWYVLLDAAKACASNPPDLSTCPADFVALSYYKIFGYPTGLGALLVRRGTLANMRKQYFGGGTVAASCAETTFFRRRPGAEGFEDGTAHFLGLAAVRHGFAQIAAVGGFPAIHQHTQMVTRWLASQLASLRHGNGSPVCRLYGAHAAISPVLPPHAGAAALPKGTCRGVVGQGPIVTFSVLHPDSSFVGHREVEKIAALSGILLRTGCFCNPGACALHLGMTPGDAERNFEAGHACWDDMDLIDGRPTGAVRVSFGYMSSLEDAAAVVQMLRQYFVRYTLQHCHPDTSNACQDGKSRELVSADSRIAWGPRTEPCKPKEEAGLYLHSMIDQASASSLSTGSSSQRINANESSAISSCTSSLESPKMYTMQGVGSLLDSSSSSSSSSFGSDFESQSRPIATASSVGATSRSLQSHSYSSWHNDQQQPEDQLGVCPPDSTDFDQNASGGDVTRDYTHSSSLSAAKPAVGQPSPPVQDSSRRSALQNAPMLFHDQAVAAAVAPPEASSQANVAAGPRLGAMWIYPIKSCAGARVHAWPLCPTGLLYDRYWALVDADGHVLTQKRLPALARLYPWLNLEEGWIELRTTDAAQAPLRMTLPGHHTGPHPAAPSSNTKPDPPQSRIINICAESACSQTTVVTSGTSSEVAAWFRHAIGVECWLVQQHHEIPRRANPSTRNGVEPAVGTGDKSGEQPGSQIGFANEGQLLLVNAASLADVDQRLSAQAKQPCADVSRFRPNLLVEGAPAFAEDAWTSVSLGSAVFSNAGPCTRCEMVCMDQRTGLKAGPEPLLTLASFRRIKGRILFGILLSHQPSPLLQHQHMRAPQQGSGNHESHDPAQMRQQLNAVAMRGEEGDGQATVRFLSTQQTAQGRLKDDIFPVLRVGMPLIPSM